MVTRCLHKPRGLGRSPKELRRMVRRRSNRGGQGMKAMLRLVKDVRPGSMARLLFCAGCAERGGYPAEDATGERRVVKWGEMAHPGVKCDRCCRELMQDERIAAVTVFDRQEDYWPWEGFYLLTPEVDEAEEPTAGECGCPATPDGWSEIEGDGD